MALMARFASPLVDAGPIVFQPCTRLPGKKRELVADTQDPSQPCYIRVPLTIVYSFVIANHFPFSIFIIFQVRAILLLVLFVSIND